MRRSRSMRTPGTCIINIRVSTRLKIAKLQPRLGDITILDLVDQAVSILYDEHFGIEGEPTPDPAKAIWRPGTLLEGHEPPGNP
jgi:hypothetical protein